ncbi:MAG: hypothetical protein P1V13_06105 [Rhizobiaceae bacterium]|nr:hypothetical protein [Rhizobiaceae bacterium]
MKRSNKVIAGIVAGILGLGAAGSAYAAKSAADMDKEKAETAAIMGAKLTVADAAKTAETQTGDRAVDVSIENENGVILYEVETLKADGTETRVMVGANDGKIVKVAVVTDDEKDGKGDEDGNEANDEDGDDD